MKTDLERKKWSFNMATIPDMNYEKHVAEQLLQKAINKKEKQSICNMSSYTVMLLPLAKTIDLNACLATNIPF